MERHPCHKQPRHWYTKPLYLVLIVTACLLLASAFFPILHPFVIAFMHFWHTIWWAILLGIFLAGMIDALVPEQYVSSLLAAPGHQSIFRAAILGFLLSACSHGILAISMELYKKGASVPAVITFLLASPWANIAITLLLFSFFGVLAFAFILAALVIALITGFIYQWLDTQGWVEHNPNSMTIHKNFSIKADIKQRWHAFECNQANMKMLSRDTARGMLSVSHMMLWWVIIGTIIGSALDAYVPHAIFQQYLGPGVLGLLTTLLIATIIEVCSEGSAPIAFTLYQQTGAFGNAFIFLMAGVVTDVTEIGLIWTNIGKRAALFLPLITVPQALLVAILFNTFA